MIFFSSNITLKRKLKGWTQEQAAGMLSEKLGREIKTERYQQWEVRGAEPEYEILAAIAELFNIDDLYLFIVKDLTSKFIPPQPTLFADMEV